MSAIRVFVVRPFAKKEGIDFERIDAELIQPALSRLAQIQRRRYMRRGTTQEVIRHGSIRKDMFERPVTADLVIADV